MNIEWLEKLIINYQYVDKTGKLRLSRTPEQVDILKDSFSGYSSDVMLEAARRHILESQYFPKPSDLYPHVLAAQEDARGEVDYKDEGDAIHYGRWRSDHIVPVTDAELFEFEQARNWATELDEEPAF